MVRLISAMVCFAFAEACMRRRAEKLVKKQAEAEARLKAEQMKKKGGKGLCKHHV